MKNKMYLTKAEAEAKGLLSNQEQIDRWNRAQEQIRAERKSLRDFARAFTPNKHGEYA